VVTWIVVAVLVLAFVVLFLVARPLLVRLPGLLKALTALQERQAGAQVLQEKIEALAARAAQVQEQVTVAQEQRAVIAAGRESSGRGAPEFLSR
jgi:biopolymer transport protein ExbB/TolQ